MVIASRYEQTGTSIAQQAPKPDSMDLYFQGLAWFHKGRTPNLVAQARKLPKGRGPMKICSRRRRGDRAQHRVHLQGESHRLKGNRPRVERLIKISPSPIPTSDLVRPISVAPKRQRRVVRDRGQGFGQFRFGRSEGHHGIGHKGICALNRVHSRRSAEPLRHRQTKGAATDMLNLKPPRHTPTLRISVVYCGVFASGCRFALILLGALTCPARDTDRPTNWPATYSARARQRSGASRDDRCRQAAG